MRKKRQQESDEHMNETWLIPYADLLTLLLALFIVLFASSTIDSEKFEELKLALSSALDSGVGLLDSPSLVPKQNSNSLEKVPPKKTEDKQNEKQLQELKNKLQTYIDSHHLNTVITLTDLPKGIQFSLKDVILFDSGSAQLKPDFLSMLRDIAGLIQTVDNPINIEGHTDNRPISSAQFPSNWELSAARAAAVLHYFQEQQINPARMEFTGYGEYHPLYPNDTPEHLQANRRVNIVILRK